MILSKQDSRTLMYKCTNATSETPKAIELPDGDPKAERVSVRTDKKTGQKLYCICAPWLLVDIFSIPAKKGGK